MSKTAYDYKLPGMHGQDVDLSAFKGKKILLVNTASACGFTPQYKQMEELHENFKDKLVVVGVPCNDFGNQEPGSDAEIEQFCTINFGVKFPLTGKIKIRGPEKHPLYEFLTKKELNGFADSKVEWNFQKYLLDENGNLIAGFMPNIEPLSEEILRAIEK